LLVSIAVVVIAFTTLTLQKYCHRSSRRLRSYSWHQYQSFWSCGTTALYKRIIIIIWVWLLVYTTRHFWSKWFFVN